MRITLEDYNEYTNYATNPDGCDIGWVCTEEGQVYLVAFCYGREGVTRGDDDRRVNRHVWMVVLSSGGGILNPDEVEELDALEADLYDQPKSQSQRLRNVMYVRWQQLGSPGDFKSYYRTETEKIINHYKSKLDE